MRIKTDEDDLEGHGNRPWVYFMIDCFFLITQFFLITFHIKSDEVVLPQTLKKVGTAGGPVSSVVLTEPLSIHVLQPGGIGQPAYVIMGETRTRAELAEAMKSISDAGKSNRYEVRVSYDGGVAFTNVFAVMDICKKYSFETCRLIPATDKGIGM